MNPKAIALRQYPVLVAGLALALFASSAHAQLMVHMQLDKKVYVDHEPITATITVKNLAGHDLILSGPGGGPWVNFDLRRGNNGLSQRPDAPTLKPRALKAGGSFTYEVNLGRFYPLGLPADYGVTANVYYPPLKKYFSSKRCLVRVNEAKTLWSESFGIPQGNNRPIQFRDYSLLSPRGGASPSLYVRVASQDGSTVYSTRSLGNVLRTFQPAVDIDSANHLHVLHLGAPNRYAHSVIDTDGFIIRRDYYTKGPNSQPSLRNNSGSLVVRGGIKTDRHGTASSSATGNHPRQAANRVHLATERPPGLPR